MPASPSVFSWPIILDLFASLAPALAAWRADRLTRHDPIGQMAMAWAAMTGFGVLTMGSFLARQFDVTRALNVATTVILALLLVPPLLTWIGPTAKRWQLIVLGVLAVGSTAAIATLGMGRRFNLVAHPVLFTVLTVLTLAMLAAQARRAGARGERPAERGWLWIGGGHLVYFLAATVGVPLVEAMVPRNWGAVIDLHFGRLLIYSATMFVIAYGVWLSRRQEAGAPARASTLASSA